ncbi:GMC family oxidoreductase [Piscinibacter sp.]|uniref:GMC family oxidoreductase n=1 Tax=Piscinibacter sp. TaxID=1903157 RepID=UPI002C10080D|nr:GMC family oxidoreductase N-terminal domain-containing protein [Albitalea sp.]HUG25459.1 GMC family oxidoreductase N-terminal domain-containing protein [Albitalea sp.]
MRPIRGQRAAVLQLPTFKCRLRTAYSAAPQVLLGGRRRKRVAETGLAALGTRCKSGAAVAGPWLPNRRAEYRPRRRHVWHGQGGPLTVSPLAAPNPLARAFVDAAVVCGHPRNPDFNGEHVLGAGLYHTTTRHGRRCSSATAFLHPVRQRTNLHVFTHARTLRVLLEGDRAVGVEVFRARRLERIDSRREVIVACGGIDSPKLLMLSGIGDPHALEPLGITVAHALTGVGAGLVDHVSSGLLLQPRKQDLPPPASHIAEAGLFMRSRMPEPGFSFDIQFHVPPYAPPWAAARGTPRGMSLNAVVARPSSRGALRLRSADPMDPPVIDPAYLQDPVDVAVLIEGLREARRVAEAMIERGDIVKELLPGPGAINDLALEQWARTSAECVWQGTVLVGDRCVIAAWPLGVDRRKRFAGTAIFSAAGTLIAAARATWIETPAPER